MADFFSDIDYEDAEQMEQLSRLMFEFRSSRDTLLKQYEVTDAAGLLDKIRRGELPEHPGYEHYLSLNILEEMRETVRNELKNFLPGVKRV